MALFESYERRIEKINSVLSQYGISSVEECRDFFVACSDESGLCEFKSTRTGERWYGSRSRYRGFNLYALSPESAVFRSRTTVLGYSAAVYILLWTCLLIVPGIIASYSYAMTDYILAEQPEPPASSISRAFLPTWAADGQRRS